MNVLYKGRNRIHIAENSSNLALCKDSRIEGYTSGEINSSDIIDAQSRSNYNICKKCLVKYFKIR